LRSLLEGDREFRVVAEAGNGQKALETVQGLSECPQVILMDITMPELDGLETTQRMKDLFPACKILALTVHEDKQYFFEMLRAGASGYITKRTAADELVLAVRSVAQGNVYLQPALARWLLEDYRRLSDTPNVSISQPPDASLPTLDILSDREKQVLELIAQSNSAPKIGEILEISPKTVARHRERIMSKLNMHSSTDLVKYAIKTGLIDL
jgi:DNA-binding NarL/FixJ family response regulator